MSQYHKHRGAMYSDGRLKSHPVTQNHKDKATQRWHDLTIKLKPTKKKVSTKKKAPLKKTSTKRDKVVMCKVDKDGYININLDTSGTKGLRVTFTRDEGRHKKTVPLQIENKPSRRSGKGNLVKNLTM